jgi:hypothetical protein
MRRSEPCCITTKRPRTEAKSPQVRARNAIAEEIRALRGVTDDKRQRDAVQRSVTDAIHSAQENGSHCAQCERVLRRDEPVWRTRLSLGWAMFACHSVIAPLCQNCKSDWRDYESAASCEGCGRLVHNEVDDIYRRWTFCCEKCAHQIRREKRRRQQPTRSCQACGEIFEPVRADAKFCSVACKQRAYRRRVMDRKLVSREIDGGAP